MIFERIKSEGIAHNSYFIGSENDAAVIDPRRDCQIYVDLAQQHGLRIKHIFETHRNEDYVIGSVELNNLAGAEIYHGPGLDWKYGNTLRDSQEFKIGKLRLTAMHTPGHTDESMSYALTDLSSGEATVMVFTGDALFVDDVGRTDLYGPEEAPSLEMDMFYTKQKINAGADFAITQMFFDNRFFYGFMEQAAKAGIRIPIIPGIMPITDIEKIKRFSQMCGATLPASLIERMQKATSADEAHRFGIDFATRQCEDLWRNGVRYFHFYTLNRSETVTEILHNLGWMGNLVAPFH